LAFEYNIPLMKKNRLIFLFVTLILSFSVHSLLSQALLKADINIDLNEEKAPIPAGLYGIFMEEINHAFDGGIYAELIRNRSFEEGVLPPGMKLVENENGGLRMELESLPEGVPEEQWDMPWPWNGNCEWDPSRALIGWSMRGDHESGAMKLTEVYPMNEASSRSLELTVGNTDGNSDTIALINEGYWGINIEEDVEYDLKFYLRPGTFNGIIIAAIESTTGEILASEVFNNIHPGKLWEKFTSTLTAAETCPDAIFSMTFIGQGKLQVDFVSLFPPTFKNRENGLRIDLAEYLEEYKPDFVRYPGGCYVQGLSWESAPDWRKMVCPPEERPGMWGYWKYRSTDGFGYHEFLQFCEDIGADAMYVSFAGMTVHPDNNWPLDDIDTIIGQTLDAIEYALGPTDSKWGKVRSDMGHPEPFPLKYIEIGNEHPPAIYGEYYTRFREAIKSRYPEITVIMSMFWSGLNHQAIERAGDENIDMVDEHAYRHVDWIRSNFDYFDAYKRKPWSVYVGEYASHHNNGNLYAALSDAAYLMMMERNGDMVKLASYAPLFVNVNDRSWGVNLIEFDAARSFAHASYYVQKVFNAYRPDVNLEMTTEVSPGPDMSKPGMTGKLGLGSFNTNTEFKELKIYDESGRLIFSDDFDGLQHWDTPGKGSWKVEDNKLVQEDQNQAPSMLLLKNLELTTGRVTVKARKREGKEGFVLFFNVTDQNRFIFCNYGAAENRFSEIQSWGNPENFAFKSGKSTQGEIEADRWYDLELIVHNHAAEMYLDGELISNAAIEPMETVFTAAGYNRDNNSVVVKAVNYNADPVQASISLNGATRIKKKAKHIVIASENIEDQNTLDKPHHIVPGKKEIKNASDQFTITLPPFSVNLLEIDAKK
jgi:alpha-L-arabinofuranosidase